MQKEKQIMNSGLKWCNCLMTQAEEQDKAIRQNLEVLGYGE